MTSSTIATRGAPSPSAAVKSRPERSGMPMAAKYSGMAERKSARSSRPGSAGGRPSIVSPLMFSVPLIGRSETPATATTPGSDPSRSRTRS